MVRYGLIGRHLGHSFSERYFSRKFEQEGLADRSYELFELAEIAELTGLLSRSPDIAGLNVTIPYKQEVMPLLHVLDPIAAAVGAVNTIRVHKGVLTGYNTDVDGFRATLVPFLDGDRPRALVLGSGGASRAVVFVLKELGIKFRVVSRSLGSGDITWAMLDPLLVSVCPLIINTTPLGMHPDVDGIPPLPMEAVGPKHCLVDLIYNPEMTKFMRLGKERGARVTNGMTMLHEQAEASWRIWNRKGL